MMVAEFQEFLEVSHMLANVDNFVVAVAFYLFFYVSAVGARVHAVYLYHDIIWFKK